MSQPEKAKAYDFYVSLVDANNPSFFIIDPTIAAGDFQISKDDGALANLVTLPVVVPAGSSIVKISLDATEMDALKATVIGSDAAGAEWEDITAYLDIPAANLTRVAGRIGLDKENPVTTNDDNSISFGDVEIEATNFTTHTVQSRTT